MAATLHPYLRPLRDLLAAHADPVIAAGQRAYMKEKFVFFGIKTNDRRSIMRSFLQEHGRPALEDLPAIIRSAYAQPQREFHYTAMEFFTHAAKKLDHTSLPLAGEMILTHSWWDTVDHIAVYGVGAILQRHPEFIAPTIDRYIKSGELWLQRTALIFQLQYKQNTYRELLFSTIEELAGHKDFFIRKGIGWALRQYARTDPQAVAAFVRSHRLSPLSMREATKHIGHLL